MGTRSLILLANDEGYKGIYCHWDGYPDHNGEILKNNYFTYAKMEKLIKLGGISILGEKIGKKTDFNKSAKGQCVAYHRDRGEELEIITLSPVDPFSVVMDQYNAEYIYVMDKNGNLKYSDTHCKQWHDLIVTPGITEEKIEEPPKESKKADSIKDYEIKQNLLKAIGLFSSTEETRQSLNGVHLDLKKGEHPVLVATDGHTMLKWTDTEKWGGDDFSTLIPSSLIKNLKKVKPHVRVTLDADAETVRLKTDAGSFEVEAHIGKFPDYTRPEPKGEPVELKGIGFNASLLYRFHQAFTLVSGSKRIGTDLTFYGETDPIGVTTKTLPELKGLLMPMRT
ncbi:hypothetical protein KAR91_63095 [Candidatus Pacearchaeota archaeon]|nr:hypothetical protein [Candidatus Pacearchaeota archaeon]